MLHSYWTCMVLTFALCLLLWPEPSYATPDTSTSVPFVLSRPPDGPVPWPQLPPGDLQAPPDADEDRSTDSEDSFTDFEDSSSDSEDSSSNSEDSSSNSEDSSSNFEDSSLNYEDDSDTEQDNRSEPNVVYFAHGGPGNPAAYEAAGGIRPRIRDNLPDEAYGYDTFGPLGGPWLFVHENPEAYRSSVSDRRQVTYLYEVATGPQMVRANGVSGVYWALGWIPWSQVRRYRAFTPVAGDWVENGLYDPRWENYQTSGDQPQLSGLARDHPLWCNHPWNQNGRQWVIITRQEEARDFMTGISKLGNMTEMLGWGGDFSSLGVTEPHDEAYISMTRGVWQNISLVQFPWDTVTIPDNVRNSLSLGRMSDEECRVAIRILLYAFWTWVGCQPRHSKRSEAGLASCDAQAEQSNCTGFSILIQDLKALKKLEWQLGGDCSGSQEDERCVGTDAFCGLLQGTNQHDQAACFQARQARPLEQLRWRPIPVGRTDCSPALEECVGTRGICEAILIPEIRTACYNARKRPRSLQPASASSCRKLYQVALCLKAAAL